MPRLLPIAVLASGEGTTLDGLAEELAGGRSPARIALVVADRPHVPAIEKARRRGLPTAVIPARGRPEGEFARDLTAALRETGSEIVLLAGFLAILPPEWVREWSGRVLNLHPSLLPKYGGRGFYGRHVHEAVLAAGDRETGVTVHLVTHDVDGGPILLQEKVPVEPGDTPESLRARVHPIEVRLLAEAVRRFATGEWPIPYRRQPEEPTAPDESRRTRG
jgi:phosphoribosylglycinamide formyltransferase-1